MPTRARHTSRLLGIGFRPLAGLWGLGLGAAWSLGATVAFAAPLAITNAGFEDLYLGSNLPAMYGGVVPAGAFPTGPAPAGWTPWYSTGSAFPNAFIGVLNPGRVSEDGPMATFFPTGAPEGDNAVLLYHGDPLGGPAYGVSQVLAATLQPNTSYTLEVEVGNIDSGTGFVEPYLSLGEFHIKGFPGYQVQLRAGGMLLAQDDDTLSPGEGEWGTSTVEFTTGDSHPRLDANLEIRLVSLNEATAEVGQSGVEVDFDDVRLDASPAAVPTPVPAIALWATAVGLAGSAFAVGRLRVRAPSSRVAPH